MRSRLEPESAIASPHCPIFRLLKVYVEEPLPSPAIDDAVKNGQTNSAIVDPNLPFSEPDALECRDLWS